MTKTLVNHKSPEENLEWQIWIVRYIENKIGKTQGTLLKFIFLIPGTTTFNTLFQVSSSMYYAFLGITQDNSGNTYLVTKLISLILGCNFIPFSRNITGPFTLAALPIRSNVTENIDKLKFCQDRVYLCSQEPLGHPNYKGSRFHPNSIESNEKNE